MNVGQTTSVKSTHGNYDEVSISRIGFSVYIARFDFGSGDNRRQEKRHCSTEQEARQFINGCYESVSPEFIQEDPRNN